MNTLVLKTFIWQLRIKDLNFLLMNTLVLKTFICQLRIKDLRF